MNPCLDPSGCFSIDAQAYTLHHLVTITIRTASGRYRQAISLDPDEARRFAAHLHSTALCSPTPYPRPQTEPEPPIPQAAAQPTPAEIP